MKVLFRSISKQIVVLLLSLLVSGLAPLSAKSLWLKPQTDERGFFSDTTAYRVGDILTVNVTEASTETKATTTYNLSSGHTTTDTNPVQQFLYNKYVKALGGPFGREHPATSTSTSSHTGTGGITYTAKYLATFSALVIDVLPNGNLVVEGARFISAEGDNGYLVLRGIVRPFDIASDNTIDAIRIADAQIEYVVEGSVADVAEKGMLTRLSDSLKLR